MPARRTPPTDQEKKELLECAYAGMSRRGMAMFIGWPMSSFRGWLLENPEFDDQLNRRTMARVRTVLNAMARGKATRAQRDWLMRVAPDKMEYVHADRLVADDEPNLAALRALGTGETE